MNRKKLFRQLALLAMPVLLFALLDISIYSLFTARCITDYSSGLQAKSVDLETYLPFDPDSQVVRTQSSLELTGQLPVLDGAAAFYPIFAAVVQAVYPEDSVHFNGKDFEPDSLLQYRNTRGAYQAVVDGQADMIFCVAPSEEQLAYAREQGVELTFLPIGREAFVFLVNANNPVDTLTQEEIRGIYTGKYQNWDQLGGASRRITALQRNTGSGSQSALLNFLGVDHVKPDRDAFIGSAIGFSFRYYVEGIVGEGGVKMLAVDGVYPSTEHIRDGSYPIINDLYLVYRTHDTNENVAKLADWMLGPEGQAIVEATGYVGVAE